MRWMVICLIALLGLASCSKKAVLEKDGVGVQLSEAQWTIGTPSEGIWKVGRTYRDIVSKSLTVVLELPKLKDDDVEHLQKTFGVDAWLVKVIQSNAEGSRIELTTLYAPFRAQQKGRTSNISVKAISFGLTYAAWAISERFRRFQCPAFSHDRRLRDWELRGSEEPLTFAVAFSGKHDEKLNISELVPMNLNIGNTMVGDYYFEVALYSSSKKQIYSAFTRLPRYLHVMSEKTVNVEGCAGIHPEYGPITPEVAPRKN